MRIPVNIHASWQHQLTPLFNLPSMVELNTQILPKCQFYPQPQNIFNVFRMPLNEVKVVILGQDPYPRAGQAVGYSFAVDKTVSIPKSLKIIQQEVLKEYGECDELQIAMQDRNWRTLHHWRQQGVFLLNTSLTVEKDRPGSHIRQWKPFTNEVIKLLAIQQPVWMLWGSYAHEYEQLIKNYTPTTSEAQILKSAHPASESYPGNTGGFYGCKHFWQANNILQFQGKNIINW